MRLDFMAVIDQSRRDLKREGVGLWEWTYRGLRGMNRAEPQGTGAPPKRRPNVVGPTHHKPTTKKLLFAGIDVHAQSITIALASGDSAESASHVLVLLSGVRRLR